MNNDALLEYLQQNKSYQLLQQVIQSFYGFGLQLVTLDGEFIASSHNGEICSARSVNQDPQFLLSKRFSDLKLLNEIRDSLQSKIVASDWNGNKQLLVPIVRKKELIGFICASEDDEVHLTEAESQITLDFLTDYVKRLVQTDLEFVEYFQYQDMTHQQCIIHDVLNYVKEHYYEHHLTLRHVADIHHVSYHYLSSLFTQEMHISFKNYLNRIRLEKAKKLLKSKNVPISQVAYQCGFDDPAYFSKFFKQKMGMSPADCRCHPVSVKIKQKNVPQYALAR